MLQCVLSLAHASSTTACHTCCMRNCTGSTFWTHPLQTESHSASLSAEQGSEVTVDCCTSVSDIPSRHHLRSATRHHLTVPRYWLGTFGHWAFSVRLLQVWNSLSDSLRDPELNSNSFNRWKWTYFVVTTQHIQRNRDASWLCAI